jgi:hypothetical protein
MEQDAFKKLYTLGLQNNQTGQRYCEREGQVIPFTALPDHQCWACPHFVLNEGCCDPL